MTQTSAQASQDRYLRSRHAAREIAREWVVSNPLALSLIDISNEYVSATMFLLSGKDVRGIKHGIHIAKLIVSFVRTHFIATDLATQCEIIEAAVLIRKQFELLARINEIHKAESVDHLLKRTPNLTTLHTQIRQLYGSYSEIAHSSAFEHLQLLGSVDVPYGSMTTVYPVFTENAYVCLSHIAFCVVEYFAWADAFLQEHFAEYDKAWAYDWLSRVISAYEALTQEGQEVHV